MKPSNIKDIARESGFGISTVSMALRGHKGIAEKTRQRILEVASQLNYRPNQMARGLAGSSTNTIGILVSTMRDLFQVDVFSTQEEFLGERGYSALLSITHSNGDTELKAIEALLTRGVDGIILDTPPRDPRVIERLRQLSAQKFPIVVQGRFDIPGVDSVHNEDVVHTCALTRHLLELGHRRIALVTNDKKDGWRSQGYLKAHQEMGLTVDPGLMFECGIGHQDVTQIRQRIMSVKNYPTAIFAHNDDMAAELIADLITAGFDVPGDVSVVGINDGWYSTWVRVPLTTLRLPLREIAQKTAQFLLERIEDPMLPSRDAKFDAQLVIRQSSAPPRDLPMPAADIATGQPNPTAGDTTCRAG